MRRTAIGLLVLAVLVFSTTSDAQRRKRGGRGLRSTSSAGAGKIAVPCPTTLNDITDCPDTGCGPSLDPNLNKQKNIQTNTASVEDKDFQYLADLADPVPGFAIGDSREKLTALGEGKMIRIVAWALKARKGVKESCNCGLTRAADTDNHIVLVDPSLSSPTLGDEPDSQTAEFTPRARLDHPNLKGTRLQSQIVSQGGKLLVRITGQQMFDSQHSLEGHLNRHNNWEIHPVFGLEFCPKNKTCTAGSDANWKDIEQ
jgi:hypothetical protein